MSERITAYDIGGFFRVEHQQVPHKSKPYEFVTRIGAVTMLPVALDAKGIPQAVVIKNERYHYGTSVNLPAGNLGGSIDRPEDPRRTALRELREETGYGYPRGVASAISMFRLREVSNSIDYPRFFGVMHGVEYIGGQQASDHEKITLQPIPLEDYIDPLLCLQRGETYPEVNAAFAKAGMELGRSAITEWLVAPTEQNTASIAESFAPWLVLGQ